jgi:beta-lactamase regulating signal transducer with metallopeptidase domain
MTHLAAFLRQPFCRALAAALLHFLWQGALVAFLLAVANAALQRATARARYAAACAALALMLVLPVATVWRISSVGGAGAVPVPAVLLEGPAANLASSAPAPVAWMARTASLPAAPIAAAEPWILLVWLLGVCALSVRFLGGFAAAERLKRRRTNPVESAWERRFDELARRLRVSRPVRLLESALVRVPTAIGIVRPVVLVPAGILTGLRAEQIDSLLAHELAHVARRDCLASLGQALAETLLFYHPAVWWVSHRIRVEREHACDDLAVAATGDAAAYARALLELEERRALVPTLAMAADGARLRDRVTRLFPVPDSEANRSPRWLAAALALGGMLALGAVARVPDLDRPAAPSTEPTMRAVSHQSSMDRDCRGRSPIAPGGSRIIRVSLLESVPTRETGGAGHTAGAPSSPAKDRAAGSLLTPQELIAFRIHGVTPEFIREIRALGYERATPDDLLALRIHDVTPEFISQMTAIFGRLPLADCAAFKLHGVTTQYVREIRSLGYTQISEGDLIAFRIHGITPEWIRQTNGEAGRRLGARELIQRRIRGAREVQS